MNNQNFEASLRADLERGREGVSDPKDIEAYDRMVEGVLAGYRGREENNRADAPQVMGGYEKSSCSFLAGFGEKSQVTEDAMEEIAITIHIPTLIFEAIKALAKKENCAWQAVVASRLQSAILHSAGKPDNEAPLFNDQAAVDFLKPHYGQDGRIKASDE